MFVFKKALISCVLAWMGGASARLASRSPRKLSCGSSYAVVANVDGGSVSFIPVDLDPPNSTDASIMTIDIAASQPMYVNSGQGKIWVDDRLSNRVLVFDPMGDLTMPYEIMLDSAQCSGLFHQWINEEYLVVACDATKSIAVISVEDMQVDSYIDLDIEDGQKPHDIVINERNEIFVSIIGPGDQSIIKIGGRSMREQDRVNVGMAADPHLAVDPADRRYIYSPQQGNDKLAIYTARSLDEFASFDVQNAHGICFPSNGEAKFFTTDINGARALVAATPERRSKSGKSMASIGSMASVEAAGGAHNCAVANNGRIFVTHSAPPSFSPNSSGMWPSSVSVFEMDVNGDLVLLGHFLSTDTTAETNPLMCANCPNPFGIGIYDPSDYVGMC